MKKVLGFASLLTVLVSLFILGTSFTNTGDGYKVGDIAEDFKLKNIDGNYLSLGDLPNAKGYIVTFTCNTCPVSVMYEDRIIELHNKYASKGYPVVAINPNDPEVKPGDSWEAMKVRANEKEFPFVYLFDEDQTVFPRFGATRTPHIFLLNKELEVKYIGAIDDNSRQPENVEARYVESAIAALEKGENPEPSFTKAVGCTIKVKTKS